MDVADEIEPSAVHERSLLARYGLTTWDGVCLATTLILIVAFAPPLFFESWTPRMALLLCIGPVGLLLLAGLVRRGDRPAGVLAGALVWTVLSAALSPAPRSALLGFVGRDLSTLIVVGSAGFWALGRMVSSRGRAVLPIVVFWGAAASAAVGIIQLVVDVTDGPLALFFGRPTGFASNPVYFGAICAVGLGAAVASWENAAWTRVVAPMVISGVGVTLSGSRVALLAIVAVVLVHTMIHRTPSSLTAAAVAIGSMIAGVGVDRGFGAGNNAANRLVAASGDGRLTVWKYGLSAWTDRPVLGHGFGRFRPSVQQKFSVDFVRDNAPDEVTQAWFDPHNVGVGVLVAVGLVGAVLYVGWALLWGARARGPIVWALIPMVLHWMLQPVSLFTLPLAMLLFGAAAVTNDEPAARSVVATRTLTTIAVVVGLALGGTLLVADALFADAADELDAERLASVGALFGDDPIIADVVAQAYAAEDRIDDELEWRRRAAEAEPDRPFWWSRLADEQLDAELVPEAEQSVGTALDLQPNNARTQRLEALLALRAGDEPRLAAALDLLCRLGRSDCTIDAAELLAELREAEEP